MRRLIAVIAVCALVIGGIAFVRGDVPCSVLVTQPSCEVALRPGPTRNAPELIEVTGAPSYPSTGELRLTTVAVQDDLALSTWLHARLSGNIDAVPREVVYPPGLDDDDVLERNAALMVDSQLVATVAALDELGYDVHGEGARVAALTDDAATDELAPGDVIVAVDDAPVADSRDVVEAVRARAPGDEMVLEVATESDTRPVEIRLETSPQDPELAYVGVLLTTALDLPVDVAINAGAIGGPSAGLMFALSIIELLGEEDLAGGRLISGTGTLDRDGNIGPVGGARQKVVGAASATADSEAAEVFLVPRGNLADARSAAVDRDVLLVPVGTLDEALAALEQLRAGRKPDDARLLAATW